MAILIQFEVHGYLGVVFGRCACFYVFFGLKVGGAFECRYVGNGISMCVVKCLIGYGNVDSNQNWCHCAELWVKMSIPSLCSMRNFCVCESTSEL